jgi:choline dehydrogenase-like flavoprotein
MGGAMGSAHQMGSCQMGTRPSKSAVDPRGRVWGTQGLYVADASVFPTASGVNPMVRLLSVSRYLDG